jgi:coenzyme F420-0:L-glutamate ligase / coenzyme F420-1:gamma-L-glutamate ligase
MQLHDFRQWLSTRRSVRRFRPGSVSQETLVGLLEAACQAPSAHNRQPWRFVVVGTAEVRARLAGAMAEKHRADMLADGREARTVEARVAARSNRLVEAPACLVVCVNMQEMDQYPDPQRQAAEHAMAVQSAALAGGHLLLAAHAEGLGACWLCAPLFAPAIVRQVLDLPDEWEPQAILVLGEAAETPDHPGRRPLDEVVVWR